MKPPLRGGCQCGALRFEITKKPLTLYACHCSNCQQQSASAFGLSMLVERDGFRFLRGEAQVFDIESVSKAQKRGMFCGHCGVRIAHDKTGRASLSVKAGTLDDRADLKPAGHIWTASKQDWVVLPEDTLIYETAPDDGYYALIERWAAQELAS